VPHRSNSAQSPFNDPSSDSYRGLKSLRTLALLLTEQRGDSVIPEDGLGAMLFLIADSIDSEG